MRLALLIAFFLKISAKNRRIFSVFCVYRSESGDGTARSAYRTLAFGKPVANNDTHVIRRRLPPLSPQIANLRGPRLIGEK